MSGRGGPREVLFAHASTIYGGMEIYVERVLARLDRDRYRPVFYRSHDEFAVPPELVAHVADLGIEMVSPPLGPVDRANAEAGRIVGMARVLRARRPAVLHVNTAEPDRPRVPFLAAAPFRRLGVVRTDHLPPDPAHDTPAMRRKVRVLDALTDRVVLVSAANREAHLARLGRPAHKLVVLQNGIELGEAVTADDRAAAKRSIGVDPDRPLVGAVGRLHEQKDHRTLVAAVGDVVRRRGPVGLAIVGGGPLEAELRAQAAAQGLGDLLVMPGHVDDPERWLAAFDVAAMPSRYEGFSLSMLEYMAAAKPCVFSDHESFLEATAGGRVARIAPVGDAAALADRIAGLLDDPAAAEALGRAARDHVAAHFTIDAHVARLMDLYDDVARA